MNSRAKLIASLGAVVLMLLVFVWQHFMNAGLTIRLTEAKLEDVNQRYEEINASVEAYDAVKARFDETVTQIRSLETRVPNRTGFIEAMNFIRNTANQQGVNLFTIVPDLNDAWPNIKSNLITTSLHIEKFPISLAFEGDYLTIGYFLEALRDGPFEFNIGRLELTSELGSEATLNAKCMLFAYMLVDNNG
ncbi:MAG: hypothetical protein K9N11_02730 [Lentisphaeria bacterium]|nr:hypothetical protein [Candidatus Neomarinimicrobiota bacterium]MCF7841746.1 hypothetical protein [Lentisphaeria bacterium]